MDIDIDTHIDKTLVWTLTLTIDIHIDKTLVWTLTYTW